MDKFDFEEKVFGGIFGVVAIIAAIAEMFVNGISAASILGAIKDVFGTLVVVILLITVVKNLLPQKHKLSFEERLANALITWQQENSHMIVKNDRIDGGFYGLGMKTDVEDFYREISSSSNAGWFVRLPLIDEKNYNKENIEIKFHLNKGTFFSDKPELQGEELNKAFDKLNQLFTTFINRKFGEFAVAGGKNDDIKVLIKRPISDDENIATLIDLINTMYQAYLVSANIGKKIWKYIFTEVKIK